MTAKDEPLQSASDAADGRWFESMILWMCVCVRLCNGQSFPRDGAVGEHWEAAVGFSI